MTDRAPAWSLAVAAIVIVQLGGIAFVVIAGIGAERAGRRHASAPAPPLT